MASNGVHKVISAQCFTQCSLATRDHVFVQTRPRSPTRAQVFARVLGHVHYGQPTVISRVPSPGDRWMLGYVLRGQPTVIFRVSASFCVNAWIRAPRLTDRDPESVSASFCVNARICARATDRDLESVSAIKKRGECMNMCSTDNRP